MSLLLRSCSSSVVQIGDRGQSRYSNSIHPKVAKGSKRDGKDNNDGKKKMEQHNLFLATYDPENDPMFSR